jgi:flagellar motor switch protein FliN/FliY
MAPPPVSAEAASSVAGRESRTAHRQGDDVQFLLDQAEEALASVDQPVASSPGIAPFQLHDFSGAPPSEEKATLDLMRDVELDVQIELGRTSMFLDEVLRLRRGSVVALDKLAGDPVDIYVNGRLIARGEVLVLNDNFCVRVAELISGDDMD